MRLRDLRFKQRFILVSLLFLVGFLVLLFVGWRTLDRVRIHSDLYENVIRDKDLIADIYPPPKYIVEPYLLAYRMATHPERRPALLKDLRESIRVYRERSAYWAKHLPEGDLKTTLLESSAEPAEAFFRVLEDEFLPALDQGATDSSDEIHLLETRLDGLFREHRKAIDEAVRLAEAGVRKHEREATEAVEQGTINMLVVAVLVVLLVSGLAYLLMRSVLSSVETIERGMRDMALSDANLKARLSIDSKDEIGQVAQWINQFLDKISALVAAVQKSSIQLTSTATEMTATSREQESTINSFGASTNQIAAAVKEISATGNELTKTMNEVADVAHESATLATSGRSSLQDMETTMDGLSDSSSSISSKLAVINEKANDINVVVTTITKVADQTNLLSVNAAIESEKAGEYGRGFLVVAREIRRLADQTATATLDIEETVGQMQSAVSAGVMEMDKFSDHVRRSVSRMSEVGDKLGRIIEQVETMVGQFEIVADGMASQSQGADQINEAMSSLQGGVQQTVSSLTEFTAAAEDLKRAVDALKDEIGKFKLED